MKLPPGFPVKVDIPVLPTVSARVTFHDFAWKNVGPEVTDSLEVTDSSNEQQAESSVDNSKNGAVSKGCKDNGNTTNNPDKEKADTGSSHNLAKKEMSKSSNKSDDDTVSVESNQSHLDDSLFEIPVGYVEDNTRFPDL